MYTAWSSFSSINRISLLPICCMSWMLHTYFVSCLSLLCYIFVWTNICGSDTEYVSSFAYIFFCQFLIFLNVQKGGEMCVFRCLFLGGVTIHLDFGIKIVLLWLIVLWANMIKFVVFGLPIKSMLLFSFHLIWQCCLYFDIPISLIPVCCILLWYHII